MIIKREIVLIILMCSIAINIFAIKPTQEQDSIRLMSYNIHRAEGMDEKIDIKRIGTIILEVNPEVAALQEVDSVVNRSGNIDILKALAEQTGMYHTFGYSILHDGGKYGNGVLTKERPVNASKIYLPGEDEARTALIIELEEYIIVNTHLSLTNMERLESVKIITEYIKGYDKPVFLLGDLNAEPHEDPIKWLESEKWVVLTDSLAPTFPSTEPDITIDYIIGYKGDVFNYKTINSTVIDNKIASDHRPIYTDVQIKRY